LSNYYLTEPDNIIKTELSYAYRSIIIVFLLNILTVDLSFMF